MARSLALLVLAAMLAAPAALTAQAPIVTGSRVRITADGHVPDGATGTVLESTRDTLVVALGPGVIARVPWARIEELDLSHGRSRWAGARRGALIAAGIGGGVTFLSTLSCDVRGDNGDVGCPSGAESLVLAGYVALSSALWGAAIGAAVGREAWEPYELTPRVSALPRGRVGLGFALPLPGARH